MGYTIGLFETFKHPELILFGLDLDVIGAILNELAITIKAAGRKLYNDQLVPELIAGYDLKVTDADTHFYAHNLGSASWFYKHVDHFPHMQLVWPNKATKWPWKKTFDQELIQQPVLPLRFTKNNFIEADNLTVFTTKQVMNGASILHVFHNENGDWQFHAESTPKEEDAKSAALREIIALDSSLNEVFFPNYNMVASRLQKGGEWTITVQELDE